MKNSSTSFGAAMCFFLCSLTISLTVSAQTSGGKIAQKVSALKQKNVFGDPVQIFERSTSGVASPEMIKSIRQFTLLSAPSIDKIIADKPAFLRLSIPTANGRSFSLLLYAESIQADGFSVRSSGDKQQTTSNPVHYRGAIDGDMTSVVSFTFSKEETMGFISNNDGNFVIGRLTNDANTYVIYNDKDLIGLAPFGCGTNTDIPLTPGTYNRSTDPTASLTTKCAKWYWETDYDLFTAKGSLANVNSYMQGVFNQVSTLYANDGISISLKTLFIWTTADPYTGTSTSGYLDQFGVYRTTFDGDLAALIGTKGGGGIAWINGICNSQTRYKMSYSGINTTYANVPAFSWTIECITHEQGHQLGSRHTHDCVWNGNNTKIDGCGDAAGYGSGTCPVPGLPAGGGTIMSYCHLTSAGINFNLGFGPQPTTLITNNINNASCMTPCTTGCTNPAQPAAISGNASVCSSTSQTYSVAAVAGATSYAWTLPSGWTGSSTTSSITVVSGNTSGNISVAAVNSCGTGTARVLPVTVSTTPSQPGSISGNNSVCGGTSQTYSVPSISGATGYSWTLPSGWTGSSTTNTISVTAGSTGGTISVAAMNSCGSGTSRTLAVSITAASPAQPGSISGNSVVCPGTSQTYSVPAVSGATTYNWTLPSGWTGTSTSNSISVTANSNPGNVSVSVSNGCGTSSPSTLAVTIGGSAPAVPGTVTVTGGSANICTGDSRTYTVPAVSGITNTWTTPTGMTINSGQGTNSINATFNSAFISGSSLSVTASGNCGTSAARTLSIIKQSISMPGSISVTGGTANVCPGDTRTYSVTAVAGITYNWTPPNGGVINSGQGTSTVSISYTPNFVSSSVVSVTANNSCGSSAARTKTVARNVASAPAAISGPATVCTGATATYSIPPVANASSYTWTVPAGGIIQGASNGTSITILWSGTRGGNLAVRSVNACGNSGSRSLKITVQCPRELSTLSNTEMRTETRVYPNPTNSIATISFEASESSMATFSVTDLAGKRLKMERKQAFAGMNTHSINFSTFSKGTYLIVVELNGNKQVLKLNVQ